MFSKLLLKMDLNIKIPTDLTVDLIQFQKMSFICNAIEAGWAVKKNDDTYTFSKKHEGKKEVYLDTYLQKFIEANLKKNKLGD
jgi:hypothetical protein